METLGIISIVPLAVAAIAFLVRNKNHLRNILPVLFWLHLAVIGYVALPLLNNRSTPLILSADFGIDYISALFLALTAFVTACALTHARVFFEVEDARAPLTYNFEHERIFYACAALFLAAMNFVFISDNLGFLWISIEATTLSSAALIYFGRTKHTLEATWKYLVVCSVGIAFALLGTILIFASSQHGAVAEGSLNLRELMAHADALEFRLLRLGFIFCLVGYGTKAGVFPLHSWLPDAHSEAPAPASAILSGALLNCALFAIWRLYQLVCAAHHEALATSLTLSLGTVTALAASFFLIHQHGLKRLWAYSSIENVGIMLIAIGLGSGPLFFLQALNHSIAKVALFLLAGNIIQSTGTKNLSEIRGLLTSAPSWAVLLAIAALAVTGAPPCGAFLSELLILLRAVEQKQFIVVAACFVALGISFIAVGIHICRILFGAETRNFAKFKSVSTSFVPALLVVLSLLCGITALPIFLANP
jgi:hydrogenase-4 component F